MRSGSLASAVSPRFEYEPWTSRRPLAGEGLLNPESFRALGNRSLKPGSDVRGPKDHVNIRILLHGSRWTLVQGGSWNPHVYIGPLFQCLSVDRGRL